jgi:hypothetical protein
VLEISQSKNVIYIVAYAVENIGVKYSKRIKLSRGIRFLQDCQYDIEKIAERVKISVKDKQLYLTDEYIPLSSKIETK